MSANEPRLALAARVLELAGRAGLLCAGAIYGVGALVTLIHLSWRGVSGVELVRPQYILAGIVAWAPLLSTLPLLYLTHVQRTTFWFFLLRVAPAPLVANYLVMFLLTQAGLEFPTIGHYAIANISLAIMILIIAALSRAIYKRWRIREERLIVILWRFGGWLLIAGLTYIIVFTSVLYPYLPASLGGGAPVVMRFMFSDTLRWHPILRDSAATERLSTRCRVIYHGPRSYFVLRSSIPLRVVEIPASEVKASFVEIQRPAMRKR